MHCFLSRFVQILTKCFTGSNSCFSFTESTKIMCWLLGFDVNPCKLAFNFSIFWHAGEQKKKKIRFTHFKLHLLLGFQIAQVLFVHQMNFFGWKAFLVYFSMMSVLLDFFFLKKNRTKTAFQAIWRRDQWTETIAICVLHVLPLLYLILLGILHFKVEFVGIAKLGSFMHSLESTFLFLVILSTGTKKNHVAVGRKQATNRST